MLGIDLVGNLWVIIIQWVTFVTNCSNLITKGERYYKVGQAANSAALCYYQVEQELLQSGAGLVLESGTTL